MSQGNDLKEIQLEPVYFVPNQRVEFRLPAGRIFSTDLFLANLGLRFPASSVESGTYGKWAGVYGMLTNVTLYDGNVVLTNINDTGRWAGFKMFNKSDDYTQGVGRFMNYGNESFIFNSTDIRSLQDAVPYVSSSNKALFRARGAGLIEGNVRGEISVKTGEVGANGTPRGMLRLRHVFDFLNSLPFIDTSFFKDFRIVCELSDDPLRTLRKNVNLPATNGGLTRGGDAGYVTTRPLLFLNELVDEELKSGLMGKTPNISWNEIEEDVVRNAPVPGYSQFALPLKTATTPLTEQDTTYHINGFNNKRLGRLLMCKEPTGEITNQLMYIAGSNQRGRVNGNGPFNSYSLLNEREQVRVNGRNIFARSGIEGSNRRLAHMVDSWGNCSMNSFGASLAYIEAKDQTRAFIVGSRGSEYIGNVDFMGVDLAGELVTDLQVDLGRTGFLNEGSGTGLQSGAQISYYNNALNLVLIAEAKKQLVMDPSQPRGYSIQYL